MHDITAKTILLAFSLLIAALMLSFRLQLITNRLEAAEHVLHGVATGEW